MSVKVFISSTLMVLSCFQNNVKPPKEIKYIALGDSYTICEGAKAEECWPTLLTKGLSTNGINVKLTANPARTGWTTTDLIYNELPLCEKYKPDFVTLLIGVNDWVHGVDSGTFHKNLGYIIDKIQALLPDKRNLILITIPDFGVTPTGAMYSGGRDISKGIVEFNNIIAKEAKSRGLKCVDIYPETQRMKNSTDLTAKDGLHPSAKEYAIWETLIYPIAYSLLKDTN